MFRKLFSENTRLTLRRLYVIGKPYWTGDARWGALMLVACVLGLAFAVSGFNLMVNYVAGKWMTAYVTKDVSTFYRMTALYFAVFCIGTPVIVLNNWIIEKLALHWRTWLTKHMLSKYLAHRNYYRVNEMPGIDNPDERLAQDINDFTHKAVSISLALLAAALQLTSFFLILLAISGQLVIIVCAYSVIGTIATIWLGKRLVGLKFNQLRKEADFRYSLIHVRTNVESIAFYRGEEQEHRRISERFFEVFANFNALIGWQRNLSFLTTGYGFAVALVPALVIAPMYFAGHAEFGLQAQADLAFGQILGALSVVINMFTEFAAFTAVTTRLGTFNEALDAHKIECADTIKTRVSPEIALRDLTLNTPNCERALVTNVTIELENGTGLLFKGPSGSGKSSLLRAVAGLWTSGSGEILRPELRDIMFLPQRPYMPLGSLREQLLYPSGDPDTPDYRLQEILARVNLEGLAQRVGGFDTVLNWPDILSLGEQQRLAFGRLLLVAPRYAILDESTSALDSANEELLYGLLAESGTTFISVGHRTSLERFHRKVLQLTGNGEYRIYEPPSTTPQ